MPTGINTRRVRRGLAVASASLAAAAAYGVTTSPPAGASCVTTGVNFGGAGGVSRVVTENSGCGAFTLQPLQFDGSYIGYYFRGSVLYAGDPGCITIPKNVNGALRTAPSAGDQEYAATCGNPPAQQNENLTH